MKTTPEERIVDFLLIEHERDVEFEVELLSRDEMERVALTLCNRGFTVETHEVKPRLIATRKTESGDPRGVR